MNQIKTNCQKSKQELTYFKCGLCYNKNSYSDNKLFIDNNYCNNFCKNITQDYISCINNMNRNNY